MASPEAEDTCINCGAGLFWSRQGKWLHLDYADQCDPETVTSFALQSK